MNQVHLGLMAMRKLLPYTTWLFYGSYFVSGCGFLFADSPVVKGFIGGAYFLWSLLLWVGSTALLVGAVTKKQGIEVIGLLPTACAVLIYTLAVLANPPYGQVSLGIAASGLLGANFWWLILRFLTIYPDLGNTNKTQPGG